MRTNETVKAFALAYPLSILITIALAVWLPDIGINVPKLLSAPNVLRAWYWTALICIPSALVYFVLLFFIAPLRRAPLPLQAIIPAAINFAPLIAFIRLLESLD